MKNRTRQYYLESRDMGTNEVVSRALTELGQSTDMETLPTTSDMKVRVFRVEYSLIQRLQASRNEYPVKFKVWYRDSETARLCEWTFHKQKKKSAKYKKATADLKNLQAKKQQ